MSPNDFELLEDAQRRLFWKRRQIESERAERPCDSIDNTVRRVLAHIQGKDRNSDTGMED